jgi:hypothetical protein
MPGNLGPPEKEVSPSATNARADQQVSNDTTTSDQSTAQPRQCGGFDTVAGLRRRRAASRRVPPLDCGCPDPWCRCSEPPLSERMIDAGRDAALHLLDAGNVPILEFEVLQALWRRGGADRVLAEQLHQASGGAIR